MFAELQLQARELYGVVLWHPHFIRCSTIREGDWLKGLVLVILYATIFDSHTFNLVSDIVLQFVCPYHAEEAC